MKIIATLALALAATAGIVPAASADGSVNDWGGTIHKVNKRTVVIETWVNTTDDVVDYVEWGVNDNGKNVAYFTQHDDTTEHAYITVRVDRCSGPHRIDLGDGLEITDTVTLYTGQCRGKR